MNHDAFRKPLLLGNIILAGLVMLCCVATYKIRAMSHTSIVSLEEFKQGLDDNNVLVINVIGDNFNIPGAIRVPFEQIMQQNGYEYNQFLKNIDRTTKIILYCASEECAASSDAQKKLIQIGFTNASHFPGGYKEWQNAITESEQLPPYRQTRCSS